MEVGEKGVQASRKALNEWPSMQKEAAREAADIEEEVESGAEERGVQEMKINAEKPKQQKQKTKLKWNGENGGQDREKTGKAILSRQ